MYVAVCVYMNVIKHSKTIVLHAAVQYCMMHTLTLIAYEYKVYERISMYFIQTTFIFG